MNFFNSIESFSGIKNPVLTLGMYDGVHIGHQSIIGLLNDYAEKNNGESVLLSFDPHPRLIIDPSSRLQLLTTLDEKIKLFDKFGLRNLIIHPFTKEFSALSSYEFVKQCLVEKIGIHTIVIGHDHHFGKNREGNYKQLKIFSEEFGFQVVQLEEIAVGETVVSSTKIRNALINGEINKANSYLGYRYELSGSVIHGDKLGRTLGFPTANLSVPEHKLIPGDGVYAVKVKHKNNNYFGLLSIGVRATVTNSQENRVEAYLLDFDGDLYGEELTIIFIDKIRNEEKFESIQALIDQMNRDKETAKEKYFI